MHHCRDLGLWCVGVYGFGVIKLLGVGKSDRTSNSLEVGKGDCISQKAIAPTFPTTQSHLAKDRLTTLGRMPSYSNGQMAAIRPERFANAQVNRLILVTRNVSDSIEVIRSVMTKNTDSLISQSIFS